MATFTTEEIDMLKSRGNDYCRSVWLGLYEGASPGPEFRDEQSVKDFMVDKYERKRYYLDPAQALKNGYKTPETSKVKPLSTLISDPKPIKLNGSTTELNRKRPEAGKNTSFAVNFDNADIFTSNNNTTTKTTQESFANFDDNPVFSNTNNSSEYLRVSGAFRMAVGFTISSFVCSSRTYRVFQSRIFHNTHQKRCKAALWEGWGFIVRVRNEKAFEGSINRAEIERVLLGEAGGFFLCKLWQVEDAHFGKMRSEKFFVTRADLEFYFGSDGT